MKAIANTPSAGPSAVSYAYRYNVLGQRERVTWADNSYWSYQYDRRDQVQSGRRYWSDSAAVAGQQYEYTFDDIGNRTLAKLGGDTNGLNLRVASYAPNRLNQYDQRTVPGGVDVIGTAAADATVTVNNEPTVRRGEYFRGEAVFDNTAGPVNGVVNTVGVKFDPAQNADAIVSQTNDVFLPRSPEYFHYDEDGNLSADGRWNYTWDGENRLVQMESTGDLSATRRQGLAFEYDWQGRRVRKTVTALSSGLVVSDTRFVYDGWNLIAELDALNAPSAPTLLRSYLWGLDLSGSEQGAGGIGGLICFTGHQPLTTSHFPAYDGNGNVIGFLASDDSGWTGQYEYGPFGEIVRTTGPMADANPFRFSTKYQDEETDLLYYGYRYYSPSLGRWLSRDPLAEEGLNSIYAFLGNAPIYLVDPYGLEALYYAQVALDTLRGSADSLTFSAVSGVRKWIWGDDGQVVSENAHHLGQCFEVAVEVTLTGGSALLKIAASRAIAKETARVIAGNLGIKMTAKEAESIAKHRLADSIRNAARETMANVAGEGPVHHVLPLLGHPGGGSTLFPTIGAEAVGNLRWFLVRAADDAHHVIMHARMRIIEKVGIFVINPAATLLRIINNMDGDLNVEITRK